MGNLLFLKVQFLESEFIQTLDHFREYLGTSRENLLNNYHKHNRIMREDFENLTSDERDHVSFWSDQEVEKLTLIFPSILNESHFLASFSLFERLIVSLCEEVRTELGVQEEIRPKNRIGHAKGLIVEHGYIDFSSLQPTWTEIELYRDIRNQIAHFGGFLDPTKPKDKTLRLKLADEQLFKIEKNRIEVQAEVCHKSLTDYEKILRGMIQQIIANNKPADYKEPF